ncbi:MAG: MFS transporter [Deltaproteobacteria bacterium]|nr:MAG: MFS transporter [Deltaproteobacteria bacterium]
MSNALTHRDYRVFFTGSMVTRLGEDMQEVAEDWLVFVMTGSPFLLGLVAFCKGPSRVLLAPIFGAVADRVDRKKILIGVYLFQAVLALSYGCLVATKLIAFWHIVILAVLDGLVAPLSRVTRQTVIPELVPKQSLVSAISINSVGNNACQVIGPLVGGLLIVWLGIGAVFFINAVGFCGIIISLLSIKLPQRINKSADFNVRKDIIEGAHFIRNQPLVLEVMAIQLFSFFLALPFNRFFPVYAKEILNIGPTGLGLLRGSFAAGNVLGGMGLILFGGVKNQAALLRMASLGLSMCLILFSHSFWLPLSVISLILTGVATMIFRSIGLSVIHLNIPNEFRGRVMGLYHMELGFRSLGALLLGSLGSIAGVPVAVATGSALFGLISLLSPLYKNYRSKQAQVAWLSKPDD